MVHVLWAEDNPLDRQLIEECLSGIEAPPIEFAEDGHVALQSLRKRRPGLLVLDIKMPRVSGLEVLEQVREAPATRDLPVVMFSSSNEPRDLAHCRKLGVTDYIQKPLDFGDFQAAVVRVVSRVPARRGRGSH